LKGWGHASQQGGPNGDLIASVGVKPHPYFQRKGNDLHLEVPLAPWEAALGAEIEVPTLAGYEKLVIPPGMENGSVIHLHGRGAPVLNEDERGDEIIRFRIVLPPNLDERSKQILGELKKMNPQDPRGGLIWRSEKF
jgi:DnaJ-class molecular chaperone